MNTDTEIQVFCKNIRALRKREGLTQREMAAVMRIGVGSLRKIEVGVLPPRLGTDAIINLARNFHIKPSKLFEHIE